MNIGMRRWDNERKKVRRIDSEEENLGNTFYKHITDGNVKAEFSEPDCNWVQCDQCLKWRRLPPGETVEDEENW